MIAKGPITKLANKDKIPAQTIERDYVLAHLCAEIGSQGELNLIFKGGTFLRLCCFDNYRYSADLDFSAIDGFSRRQALDLVVTAATACRKRLEMPELAVTADDGTTAWIKYVGPLQSKPRRLKLDISDTELVESHRRAELQQRWPDLPDGASIEGYTLEEIGAEKLRCVAERVQCRDLFDLDALLESGHLDPLEIWALYLRKAENDRRNGKQRVPSHEWASRFDERMDSYRTRWHNELSEYVSKPA
ncbi:MAG: nucleotidyl transferase AbiEii/AbiGii toxin family protein, partial [Candidatus Dormibacteraceae bacterium]